MPPAARRATRSAGALSRLGSRGDGRTRATPIPEQNEKPRDARVIGVGREPSLTCLGPAPMAATA